VEVFKERMDDLKHTKGGFQIPYGRAVPAELLRDILLHNVREYG
jgi:uncharacterized protein YdhG (YjbR/CyaY superfamily)